MNRGRTPLLVLVLLALTAPVALAASPAEGVVLRLHDGPWTAPARTPMELAPSAPGAPERFALWFPGRAVDAAELERLGGSGIRVVEPWDGTAFVVALDARAAQFASVPQGGSLVELPPAARRVIGAVARAEDRPQRVELRLFPGADPEAVRRGAAALGVRLEPLPAGAGFAATAGPGGAAALAGLDGVAWVAPARGRRVPLNEASRAAIGAGVLQAPPWSLEGTGEVAGVWDGGPPNPDHPDLAGRLVYADTTGSAHCPDCAHATHVACTVAGSGAASLDAGGAARQWRGMAPAAAVIAYDFFGDVAAEYRAAWRERGVRASNNSWGYCVDPAYPDCEPCSAFSSYHADSRDFDALVAGEAPSLLLVFAAGNSRNDGICGQATAPPYLNYRTLVPPSTAKNGITVGATDAAGAMSAFSSWGPAADGRIKPDVVADGVSVLSCADPGTGYRALSGTSMATPAVTGAALLVRELLVRHGLAEPPAAALKALLVHGARDLVAGPGYAPGPDAASGWGLVDAEASARAADEGALALLAAGQDEVLSWELEVPAGSESLRATLAWSDPAPSLAAAAQLVHDLDLVAIDPAGVEHRPWALDAAAPAAAARRDGPNRRDNLERIDIEEPVPGRWEVRVRGASVAFGRQAAALVTSLPAEARDDFEPLSPENGAAVSPDGRPIPFAWRAGEYGSFQLAFFSRGGMRPFLVLPRRATAATALTPDAAAWRQLMLRMARGPIEWGVRTQDREGRIVDSARHRLGLALTRPPVIECPAQGARFSADGIALEGGCEGPGPWLRWDGAGSTAFQVRWSTRPDLRNATLAGAGYRLGAGGFTPTGAQWRDLAARARANGGTIFLQVQGKDAAQRRTDGPPLRLVVE
ncbi:MAG: S8 family serine peptidase [Acidobacteria bacterium]|jgi:subtilisin family serine protease|nr:S8 family serine peptidase [Acidobacteriota bacterium]